MFYKFYGNSFVGGLQKARIGWPFLERRLFLLQICLFINIFALSALVGSYGHLSLARLSELLIHPDLLETIFIACFFSRNRSVLITAIALFNRLNK